MAYFARIDDSNKVVDVVVIPDDEAYRGQEFLTSVINKPGRWIQTWRTGFKRHKFAEVGLIYCDDIDVFVDPCPHFGWILDENYEWQPPDRKPSDENAKFFWSHRDQKWVKISQTSVVVLGENNVD